MKYRMLLVLILIFAVLVAAAGATLSYYVDSSTALSFDIEPDVTPTPTLTPTPTPQPYDISVLYQTSAAWQVGQSGKYKFNYSITITNNSDQPVNAWYIRFTMAGDTLDSVWGNAKMTKHLPAGTYEFVNPAYNNPSTDNILPGQSVSFGGQGSGLGQSSPQNVQVGGSNTPLTDVELICDFGGL